MVWPFGSSENNKKHQGDPFQNLDPSLREFLRKESPEHQQQSSASSRPPVRPEPTQQPSKAHTQIPQPTAEDKAESNLDVPTLYPDGRYAHLWKTYKAQSEFENLAKSDQEKLQDAVDAYKYKQSRIDRTALENCALERWEINDCFKNGPWSDLMAMCRNQTRRLDRCYTMQTKLLKALGYLSTNNRSPEVEEEIQMHADTLYHRMLAQEKTIEEAKAEGRPAPIFPPILSTLKPGMKVENRIKPSQLEPRMQEELRKRLEGLEGQERELEETAMQAELQAGAELSNNLNVVWSKQKEQLKEREQQGKATILDQFKKYMRGW